jgi:hypothetical protein
LNQNQVLAAKYFVDRMNAFVKHIIKCPAILGGKLTHYVIRYETQGRGSVHAHMLLWIDIDPQRIHDEDVIHLTPEEEEYFHLKVTDVVTKETSKLYDDLLLCYTNANIWCLRQKIDLIKKLRIIKEPINM